MELDVPERIGVERNRSKEEWKEEAARPSYAKHISKKSSNFPSDALLSFFADVLTEISTTYN